MDKSILHGKICFLFVLIIFSEVLDQIKAQENRKRSDCQVDHPHRFCRIGSIIDQSSRVGKEQKIAIQIAVDDFANKWLTFPKLNLHIKDSRGKSGRAASTAIELVKHKKVEAIIAALTLQEATLISELEEVSGTPIITIGSAAVSPSPIFPRQSSLFQMNNNISLQMQCAAAIIGHFRWRKVTAIYEQSSSFNSDSLLISQFSELLKPFNSVVELDLTFPPISSLRDPHAFIEEELKNLKSKSSSVFVLLQSSLEFASVLFEKAKKLGMMEKCYVWILYDDVVSLFDAAEPSMIKNMKGIIGFKTNYVDTGKSFHEFKLKFRRKFRSAYPEEEHPDPSLFALRAYDATWAIAKAMQISKRNADSNKLINHISSSDFEGLSGNISFKNGMLMQKTKFQVINVHGGRVREIALWSPELGFSKDFRYHERKGTRRNTKMPKELSSVHCPEGEEMVPKERKLKIGVPIRAAAHQFVSVQYDKEKKTPSFSGFSIAVFTEAVKRLSRNFSYDFVPFNGTYDEMLAAVYNKSLDAAAADILILEDRYKYVDFSQPYMDAQVVMVVKAKEDLKSQKFIVLTAFEWKLWVVMASLSLFTGAIIYLNEHVDGNPEFAGSFPQIIGSMLWFSVSLLSFAQRESIRNNLSRLVLAIWLFVIIVVAASFTAVLSSMMTVPRLQPSVVDVEYLYKTNAVVGCNREGFLPRFLVNFLKFNQENIKKLHSISEYDEAFEKGEITAAFFIRPHADLFLANKSKRYIIAKPNLQVGGLAFGFQKGSRLAAEISRAVLNMKHTGELNRLEECILSLSNSSPTDKNVDDFSLYLAYFSGPLIVSSTVTSVVSLITMVHVINKRWSILGSIQSLLMHRRISRWASFLLVGCYSIFGSGSFGAPVVHIQDGSPEGGFHIESNHT